MKDIFQQLKSLQDDPRAGGVSEVDRLNARTSLMQAIDEQGVRPKAEFATTSGYFEWLFADVMSAPLSVALVVLFVGLGGWMTTVSAAASLPGDRLYSVKIATEKAQLSLASREHKAVLHTEFAERRLSEARAINNSDRPDKAETYLAVLGAFKDQMEQAGEQVKSLEQDGDSEALQVATQVDEQIAYLTETLRQDTVSDAKPEVTEVKEKTEEISQEVETVIVNQPVKEDGEAEKTISINERARGTVNDINNRQAYLLGRITVIEKAIELQELDVTGMAELRYEAEEATARVPEAMNLIAASGYGDGFTILHDIEKDISNLESRIAAKEVEVSTVYQLKGDEDSEREEVLEETPVEEVTE